LADAGMELKPLVDGGGRWSRYALAEWAGNDVGAVPVGVLRDEPAVKYRSTEASEARRELLGCRRCVCATGGLSAVISRSSEVTEPSDAAKGFNSTVRNATNDVAAAISMKWVATCETLPATNLCWRRDCCTGVGYWSAQAPWPSTVVRVTSPEQNRGATWRRSASREAGPETPTGRRSCTRGSAADDESSDEPWGRELAARHCHSGRRHRTSRLRHEAEKQECRVCSCCGPQGPWHCDDS
jgi:hypothetical protein